MTNGADDGARPGLKGRQASFKGLGEKELGELYNTAAIRKLNRNDILIKEGDTDQTVYVILDGLVQILKEIQGRQEEIAVLSEGDWVGEIALARKIPRTATAVAKTTGTVMAIDEATLNALDPQTQLYFYKKLNDLAAERISDLARRESELTVKNQALVGYIKSTRTRKQTDYRQSEMIQGIIKKIPRLPAFAANLVVKILDESVPPAEVAEHVKEDPSLVALILKTVNSPYYGFQKKVSDIHHAIVLLGFNEVYQLVVSDGIRRTMPNTPSFRQLHAHAMDISHLSFALSQASGVGRPAEAATIGLLHHLGLCVIGLLKEKNPKLAMLIDALDPAQLGALLLKDWGLPDVICLTLEHQYSPEFSPPSMIPSSVRAQAALLYLAHLSHDLLQGRARSELPTAFLRDYAELLNWVDLELSEIVEIKLVPLLLKKINTYPARFRRLLVEHLPSGPHRFDAQLLEDPGF